jgi:hypothetical protein
MLPPGMYRATATPAGRNERKDKIMTYTGPFQQDWVPGLKWPDRNQYNSYQGQTDHDIDQEGLRDVQEMHDRESGRTPDAVFVNGPDADAVMAHWDEEARAEQAKVIDPPDEPDPHRASCLNSATCQVCAEECVTIRWSEIRDYSATVHRSELAEAVSVPGSGNPDLDPGADGHAMPANLTDLVGDPFTHGDLNGLLCDLEDRSFDDATDIKVLSIKPAS